MPTEQEATQSFFDTSSNKTKMLDFVEKTTKTYQELFNEVIGADDLFPVLIYELLKTTFNSEDLEKAKLEMFKNKNDYLIASVTMAATYALVIKNNSSQTIQKNLTNNSTDIKKLIKENDSWLNQTIDNNNETTNKYIEQLKESQNDYEKLKNQVSTDLSIVDQGYSIIEIIEHIKKFNPITTRENVEEDLRKLHKLFLQIKQLNNPTAKNTKEDFVTARKTLAEQLLNEAVAYMIAPPTSKSEALKTLQKNCLEYIENTRPLLNDDALVLVSNIIVTILQLAVLEAPSLIKYAKTGRFFFFATDSAKQADQAAEVIKNITPGSTNA